MKKNVYLILLFFVGITAGMNAQVTIGSLNKPKEGAVLDLSQSGKKLGLALPAVYLTNDNTLQLEGGTNAGAEGTIIYNTNETLSGGKGLYVWTGQKWIATNACGNSLGFVGGYSVINGAVDYSDTESGDVAKDWTDADNEKLSGIAWPIWNNLPRGINAGDLMVSEFVYSSDAQVSSPVASASPFYSAANLENLSSGITWADAVKKCANLTEGGYTDWYLPNLKEVEALYNVGMLGFYPVNIPDPNPDLYYWSSTETADYASYGYYFTSFNPNTPPSFGESAKNQSNTWGTYVARCVRRNPAGVCPAPVAILTGDASTAKQKVLSQKAIFNITYNLFSVESVEVIGLPAGITAARKGNTLTISGTAPDYDLMSEKTIDYKVILTNACGTKTTGSAGSIEVIESTVEGDSGTKYKVYSYPDGIGVWMIENLKENTGSPTMTTYSGQSEGERGYYYPSDDARTACPQGYELPTVQQVEKLRKYINSGEATAEEMDHWFSESAHAGYYWQYNSSWQDWGNNGYWWIADFYFVPYAFGADTGNINEINQMNGGPIDDYILPVRCVKSEK